MSNLDLMAVSDGLKELKRTFAEYRHGGFTMNSDSVVALRLRLDELTMAACRLENETSRCRWNIAAAKEEARRTEAVLVEIAKPDSRVVLFPVIARPVFNEGGAA